jgi:DNA-binding transcriptional LysR family regulator
MNFRHIQAFRVVMTCGTASRAAELLDVTQPAISRAIAELERDVGFPLFERVRGRMVPTAEGEIFHAEASRAYQSFERLRATAVRLRDLGSGDLRIASLPAIGNTILTSAVGRFQTDNPTATTSVLVTTSAHVREVVLSGYYHVGIVSDETDMSGLERHIFGRYRSVCVLPAGHRLAEKKVIRPTDLVGVNFVSPGPEDNARQKIDRLFDLKGLKRRVVSEAYSSATICSLVLEGTGVGIINPVAALPFVGRGLVIRRFEPDVILTICLVMPADRRRSTLAPAFLKHLSEAKKRWDVLLINDHGVEPIPQPEG